MQDDFFGHLQKAISNGRLEAYRPHNGSNEDAVIHYLWNAALCEALFPMLQQLEVAFRNTLHAAIGRAISEKEWLQKQTSFLALLGKRELEKIDKARENLGSQCKPISEDRMVGELSFGFWTSLADSRYDRIWPRFIKEAFPYTPNCLRNRPEISARANKLRKLRNAVFHHHSIWHWKDLAKHHEEGLVIIEWIEPELSKLTKAMDRFPAIYKDGPQVFRKIIPN